MIAWLGGGGEREVLCEYQEGQTQAWGNLDGSTITADLELGPGQMTFPTGVLIKQPSLPS